MTDQQYSFRAGAESPCDDAWSAWYPLMKGHTFDTSNEYRFRDATPPLPDGVYANLDDSGLPTSAVWRRRGAVWSYATGGIWKVQPGNDDETIRESGFVRLSRHPVVD